MFLLADVCHHLLGGTVRMRQQRRLRGLWGKITTAPEFDHNVSINGSDFRREIKCDLQSDSSLGMAETGQVCGRLLWGWNQYVFRNTRLQVHAIANLKLLTPFGPVIWYRGPNGVWTQEKKGIKPESSCKSLTECEPTLTHMALISLLNAKLIRFVISQNIDGLFLRANIRRRQIAELHGNFYLDQCTHCKSRFIRSTPSPTMGQKVSSNQCPRKTKPCPGLTRDTICDWDQDLPKDELRLANRLSRQSDLSICLGTSLQIEPAASMPLLAKKINQGRLVIVNLQPTRFDRKADLVIHDTVDNVMTLLCQALSITIRKYNKSRDPTNESKPGKEWRRWIVCSGVC